jgi:alpha-tubulin suppressor-like RCC1 family protein
MVTKIATGTNHALALTYDGSVYIWDSGEQSQLGRRLLARSRTLALQPRRIGQLKNIVNIGAVSTIHLPDKENQVIRKTKVYSWALTI